MRSFVAAAAARRLRITMQRIQRRCISHKPTTTTVDSSNEASRSEFFKYSWGTWATNDEVEKAKRHTPFAIEGIAEIVHRARDTPRTVPRASVRAITSLAEGRHHRIFLAELDDNSQYVLRVPYPLDWSWEARRARMRSEVATMDFARRKWGMFVPEVVSWAPTADNPLEREYILMEYLPPDGDRALRNLMSKWHPLDASVADRAKVLKVVVHLLESLLATRFSQFGSLYFTEDVDTSLQNALPYAGEEDPKLVDRWRIGPTIEPAFWQNGIEHDGSTDRGPWNTPAEYLMATARAHMAAYKNLLMNPVIATTELGLYLPTWMDTYNKYAFLTSRLVPDVPADSDMLSPRLCHPDLDPTNILVDTASNSAGDDTQSFSSPYLLDWEGATIKPYFLHGAPKFVRYNGYKIYKREEVEHYDQLAEQQKRQVDYMMAATANQFTFEFLFKHSFPTLINAFSPHVKTLREPYRVAMDADYKYHPLEIVDLRDTLIRTQEQLELTSATPSADEIAKTTSPATFTAEEIEQHATILQQWEDTIQKLPFYSTKGWIPQNVFDELIATGELVKDEYGNYTSPSAPTPSK
ncbi:uncharacterized protein V1518DRAFT_417362 [Limtongia smithiae]|uniref:uncharacterized protein n=1 Tax=Limtongia smithiae TaxID=1125753 RepID=UPI0034CEC7A2